MMYFLVLIMMLLSKGAYSAEIQSQILVCYDMKPPEELVAKLDLLLSIDYVASIWPYNCNTPRFT
jgi:hypothetical protein